MPEIPLTDIARIRAREADPSLGAHARQVVDKIHDRLDLQRVTLLGRMAELMPTPAGKLDVLRRMSDELGNAARDLVPCSRGCAKCCNIPTLVSQQEAAVIAQETGAALAQPDQWFDGKMDDPAPYYGVPCTFLRNDTCSIYTHRPFACRIHVHLDRDNTLCQTVPGESIRVPQLDTLRFDLAYAISFGGPLDVKLADVREFFPQGLDQ